MSARRLLVLGTPWSYVFTALSPKSAQQRTNRGCETYYYFTESRGREGFPLHGHVFRRPGFQAPPQLLRKGTPNSERSCHTVGDSESKCPVASLHPKTMPRCVFRRFPVLAFFVGTPPSPRGGGRVAEGTDLPPGVQRGGHAGPAVGADEAEGRPDRRRRDQAQSPQGLFMLCVLISLRAHARVRALMCEMSKGVL